ncbi:MAG: toprim domain-containing protein [Paracoccaceae bacterium]|nr:toprim domain-containing protein [Paracoccaceae bacterium]
MSLQDAMRDACKVVGIDPPSRHLAPGQSARTRVDGKRAINKSGSVMINPDGVSGVATNFATGQSARFTDKGAAGATQAPRRNPELDRQREAERIEVIRACERIVRACAPDVHPYLVGKGFPEEVGLVIDDPRPFLPEGRLGERIAAALPEAEGPLLIIPGRIGKTITTVQFIAHDGTKKNILGGKMLGASHRIATGREIWACEGIATAMSVRAALRLLGRSATVLCAFSANNVASIAQSMAGVIIAADHDKPVDTFGGLGTGEYYARKSGARWIMPTSMGDFNDMHQAEGLRAVALALREVAAG